MRRAGIVTALSVLLLGASGSTAWAVTNFENAPSGAHYAKGASEPVCVENESTNTVSCTGTEIAGVGNTNATVVLDVDYSASIVCRAPGNDKVVDPHSTTGDDVTTEEAKPGRNGRLRVDSVSEQITTGDVAGDFTCPNSNWREEVTDIEITGFTYSLTFAGFSEPAILITG